MVNNLLSINKTAKMLGICPQTLRNWEARGNFPFKVYYTLGGHRRYSEEEVEHYLYSGKEEGGN